VRKPHKVDEGTMLGMDQQQPEPAHAASEYDDEQGAFWRASDLVLVAALLAVVVGLVALLVKAG
jgi:hypothetical protein